MMETDIGLSILLAFLTFASYLGGYKSGKAFQKRIQDRKIEHIKTKKVTDE